MLTKKQIEELPKGKYTNMDLIQKFPKQQGKGKSFFDPELIKKTK